MLQCTFKFHFVFSFEKYLSSLRSKTQLRTIDSYANPSHGRKVHIGPVLESTIYCLPITHRSRIISTQMPFSKSPFALPFGPTRFMRVLPLPAHFLINDKISPYTTRTNGNVPEIQPVCELSKTFANISLINRPESCFSVATVTHPNTMGSLFCTDAHTTQPN